MCPVCDGQLYLAGRLGQLVHLECRDCGMWFTESAEERPDDEREGVETE